MRIGTKSVLFGAHCFLLHWLFVAAGWVKLYGLRMVRCPHTRVRTSIFDPRLWLCFLVHDLGYIGKPNMDGPEGEQHPWLGATLVGMVTRSREWADFCLFHSRFLARRERVEPSLLCWADKMAIALTPSWFYLPMVTLTGELAEYMHLAPREIKGYGKDPRQWHSECRAYCARLAFEHRDGRVDTWTPAAAT